MPFALRREPFFCPGELEAMEQVVLRLLAEVGLAVVDEDLRRTLAGAGHRLAGQRVLLSQRRVTAFLHKERQANGNAFACGPLPPESDRPLGLGVLPYPQWVHDLATDRLVPFTRQRLAQATRLLHGLGIPGVPGCPTDAAPALQPIEQYFISATQSRLGRLPVDPKSLESLPYVMEMAEVLGHPVRSLPVYVFSPLTLCGESLRCARAVRDRIAQVAVSDMAATGSSVPVRFAHALALAAAEVIGAAILVQEALELPVAWGIRVCPADLRSLAMVLGSPEDLLLALAGAEVDAFFHGTRWAPGAATLHTMAKMPGPQSCAEKASLMTAGALLGARHFGHAGALSLDETFSSEQLVYDVEVRDHVQRLLAGCAADMDVESCLAEAREGVQAGSFAGLESTAQAHRRVLWYPRLFERRFLAPWLAQGQPDARQRAHTLVAETLARHDFELDADLRHPLEGILARARQALGGR
ncbi:MAG: trimethylamine methyltransferase family protein [Candidatus Latescibacterota bacterium]